MPVIATKTIENSIVINEKNGILIEDTAEGFLDGLILMERKIDNFNSKDIANDSIIYGWNNITNKVLVNIFESLV